MPKFKVILHGTHFMLRMKEKRFGLLSREISREVGLYTTGFVEAADEDEAIASVFRMVDEELPENAVSTTERSTLEVDRIIVDEEGFDLHAPGGGFTFYMGDVDEDENS